MSNPIRVLQVVTHMNRGGLETMLMNYYRNIDRDKVQFDFLTHRDGEKDYDKEILAMGGKIYHLPPLNPFSVSYRKTVDKFFAEHKEYRIVHSHLDCMSALPLYYAKKHGVPVRIAHAHNTDQEKNIKFAVKKLYKRKIADTANQCFACGIEAGRWMYDGHEFQVIHNAIDAKCYTYDKEKREQLRKQWGLQDKCVIGHVGRFNIQKNHEFLLRFFKRYLDKKPESVLVMIGTGDLLKQMQSLADELGIINHVKFMGNRDDVQDWLQVMDIMVFPSLFEGLPVTLVEAQASGLPCVVSDVVTPEINLTGKVSFCSLATDIDVWCETVEQMKNIPRISEYEKICNNHYDIKDNAMWLQEYYQTIERKV